MDVPPQAHCSSSGRDARASGRVPSVPGEASPALYRFASVVPNDGMVSDSGKNGHRATMPRLSGIL